MNTITDFTKTQLATILSALDGQPHNPANKLSALDAIERQGRKIGCTADGIIQAAAGLLDGRMSAEEFRAQLRDDESATGAPGDEAATDCHETDEGAPVAATAAQDPEPGDAEPDDGDDDDDDGEGETDPAPTEEPASDPAPTQVPLREQLLAACVAAERWLQAELAQPGEPDGDSILRTLRAAIERAQAKPRRTVDRSSEPTEPRADTKQARLIERLRGDGISISEMASEFGWLRHTCHGALAGLKKNKGLKIVSEKPDGLDRVYLIRE